jgi:hypothetical protein
MKTFLLMCAALILFVSCKQAGHEVPISTVAWQQNGAFIQYRTNDSAKYDWGYYMTYPPTEVSMSTVTVIAKKMSGAINYGFGMVFCVSSDFNSLYRVLITADGWYQVTKKVSGTYPEPVLAIVPWVTSPLINTGYGAENEISVTQTSTHNFALSINGNLANTFGDPDFTGGTAGFYASIGTSGAEDFPDTPVDVRFQMTSPASVP